MDIGTAKLPRRRAARHPPSPAGRPRRDRAGDRGRVPGLGPRGDRGLPPAAGHARPGRRFGALHAGDPRPVRVPGHRPRRTRPARGRAGRRSVPRRCTPASPSSTRLPRRRCVPSNGRRVVRALEVIEITGRPFSASLPEPRYHYDRAVQIGVDIDRETLDRRIEQRVDADVGGGLRRGGPRAGGRRACARGVRRTGRSATSRSWPSSTGSSPRRRRGSRRSRAPAGSRAARTAGSARTRASPGCGTTTRSASRRRWTRSL